MTEIIVCAIFEILTFILGCLVGKWYLNRPKPKGYSITNEQLNTWIKQFYNDKDYSDADFTDFISDWLAGNVPPKEMSDSGAAEVVEPCKGRKCPCHPTREDNCTCMTKNGQCKHMINLNVICGIHDCVEEIKARGDLLTKEEVAELTAALQELQ